MNPSQILTELVNAVLAWEQADSLRTRLIEKQASAADLQAANAKLVAAIKRLRAVARDLRKLVKSPIKKKVKPLNWSKIIDTVATAATVVKNIKDKSSLPVSGLPTGIDPSKVIDMKD